MIVGSLFAVVPLVCWALMARTARVGWIVAAVLATCVAGGLGLAAGWIRSGEKLTLLAALTFVTPLVIVFGIVAERRAGAGRLRSGGVRGIAGMVVSVAYVGCSFTVVPLLVLTFLVEGGAAYVPSGAEVLPLPAGLTVAGHQDQGCRFGYHLFAAVSHSEHCRAARRAGGSTSARSPGPCARLALELRVGRRLGWLPN